MLAARFYTSGRERDKLQQKAVSPDHPWNSVHAKTNYFQPSWFSQNSFCCRDVAALVAKERYGAAGGQ